MNNEIQFVLQCSVPNGMAAELKKIVRELITTCRGKEDGLLGYEFFFNNDESELFALERYKDSTAVFTHMSAAGAALERFHEVVEFKRVEVFGPASKELADALEPFNAQFYSRFDA